MNYLALSLVFVLAIPIQAEKTTPPRKSKKTNECRYHFFFNDKDKEVRHGTYQVTNQGELLTEGTYNEGHRDGTWKTYHDKNILASRETYTGGKREGKKEIWHANGILAAEEFYLLDRKHGSFKSWYLNGTHKSKSTWNHGFQEGVLTEWHSNGNIQRTTSYKKGKLHGDTLFMDPNGRILSQKVYIEGTELSVLLHQENYNNGQTKVAYSYYLDSNNEKIKHGAFKKWFPNGEIWFVSNYAHGLLDGLLQHGKKNGRECRIEQYEKGAKNGSFMWYSEGELVRKETWYQGKLIQTLQH